jgi:DNA-binding HxlR family transcriptional regulator
MKRKDGYGQFCPIAIAAEVVAQKWTPLVLRGMVCGAQRYNDIQASVPRMSSALLSKRLKELEFAGIVERVSDGEGRGSRYLLTDAGRELFPTLDAMGAWAQKWLRREITRDENLDPDVFMWELRQVQLTSGRAVQDRRVVSFQLDGVPVAKRFYWLVFDKDDVEICIKDPGHEVDLWISAHLRTLVELWLGHKSLAAAKRDGSLSLDGSPKEIRAFGDWFMRSHFAAVGDRLRAGRAMG